MIFFESNNMAQSASTMFYQDRMPLQIRLSVKFINLETNDCLHSWTVSGYRLPLIHSSRLSVGFRTLPHVPRCWLTACCCTALP